MVIGVLKEIKKNENRVALIPVGVELLKANGHEVLVEKDAGRGSGFQDEDYRRAGATIIAEAAKIYREAEMIMKVKEPLPAEYPLLRAGQIVFTYFHFAASRELTEAVIKSKCIAIAYETVQTENKALPLLIPMSEVAGRLSIQEGAKCLEKLQGGVGILLGGVPGVEPAQVVILGGGVVGSNAAKIAAGFGARVTILDLSLDRLRYLDDVMPKNVQTVMSNPANIRKAIAQADLVIGGVLIPGAKAPHLITREMLSLMKKGSVIVDVAVDQGGCVETIHPTTHDNPTYEVDGIVHYAVANMPGAVPMTSTFALTNATLPYAIQLANLGYPEAVRKSQALAYGVNIAHGMVTTRAWPRPSICPTRRWKKRWHDHGDHLNSASANPTAARDPVGFFHLQPFAPAWWAPGGHGQTLAGHLLASPPSLPETRWHTIPVSLGDRVVLGENQNSSRPAAGMVLLLHGLGGQADSPYMVRVAQKFVQQGWTVFRLNHRGAGQGRGLAKWLYHAGRSEDLRPVIQFCVERAPHQPLIVIGFSLSGNMLLKYLAEQGGATPPNLAGALAVSAPIKLALSAAAISRRRNSLYEARFLRLLQQTLAERAADFPDFPRVQLPPKRTLVGFDQSVTAPLGGFASAEDYYQKCSAHQLLDTIRTPVLLLAAADDPFVPRATYADLPRNPRLQMLLTRSGGHMGFIAAGRTPCGDRRWLDYALYHHARAMCQAAAATGQMA